MRVIVSLGVVVCLITAGCVSTLKNARKRAAIEMECPEDQLTVEDIGGSSFRITGCDQQATYTCAVENQGTYHQRAVCIREGGVATREPAAPAPAAAATPAPAAPTQSDPPIGSYLRATIEQRRGAILGCTAGQEVTVIAAFVRDGTVTFALAGPHSGTDAEACSRQALGPQRVDPQPGAGAMIVTLTPTAAEAAASANTTPPPSGIVP